MPTTSEAAWHPPEDAEIQEEEEEEEKEWKAPGGNAKFDPTAPASIPASWIFNWKQMKTRSAHPFFNFLSPVVLFCGPFLSLLPRFQSLEVVTHTDQLQLKGDKKEENSKKKGDQKKDVADTAEETQEATKLPKRKRGKTPQVKSPEKPHQKLRRLNKVRSRKAQKCEASADAPAEDTNSQAAEARAVETKPGGRKGDAKTKTIAKAETPKGKTAKGKTAKAKKAKADEAEMKTKPAKKTQEEPETKNDGESAEADDAKDSPRSNFSYCVWVFFNSDTPDLSIQLPTLSLTPMCFSRPQKESDSSMMRTPKQSKM